MNRHMGKKIVIISVFFFLIYTSLAASNLEIHHIDVGQGDATLVIGPDGTTILIDAGANGYFTPDGGKIVFEYLDGLGVDQLDYVVATHRDADHIGGFAFSQYATSRHSVLLAEWEGGVIKSWPGLSGVDDDGNGLTDFSGDDGCSSPAKTPDSAEIGQGGTDPYFPAVAFDNGEESFDSYCSTSKTFRRYIQTVEAGGIRVKLDSYEALMEQYNNPLNLGDGATATVVCSSGWVAENPEQVEGAASSGSVNGRSIGIYIQYKGFDYLAAGDLTGNESPHMEQALRDLLLTINDTPAGDPVDVLKISHHGSNSSSEQSYLNDLKPETAIISVGDDNSYGHPDQEVIDRLHNLYPAPLQHVYLTEEGAAGNDYYGLPHDFLYEAVVVSTDGYTYSISNSDGAWDEYQTDSLYSLQLSLPEETAEKPFYTGAAGSLMNVKFLDPAYTKSQTYLYDTYHVLAGGEDMKGFEINALLNNESPEGYYFTLFTDSDQEMAIKRFIHWIDYQVPAVAVPNVPALVPVDGTYNWLAVSGFVTDIPPCNQADIFSIPDFTFYGVWLADPRADGLGFNVYQTAEDLKAIYQPVANAYRSVVEPPEEDSIAELECALREVQMSIAKAPTDKTLLRYLRRPRSLRRYDWQKIIPRAVKENLSFMEVFSKTAFSDYLLVKNLDTGKKYSLSVFGKGRAAFLLDPETAKIRQISWTINDEKYPALSRYEAMLIARLALKQNGCRIRSGKYPTISLVWSRDFKTSRFQPSYRLDFHCGPIVYVHQDGRSEIV